MKLFIVDAFTATPFGGNTAGVALIEETQSFPSDNLMQQIAAELRYSETAFVQQLGAAEFKVRYFTPCGEVDLCGHATIATFGMMYRMGFLAQGEQCLIHTLAGDLNVIAGKRVMMMMAKPQVIPATVDVERLHSIMGATSVNTSFPVEIVSTGLPDIIMPLDNVEQLYSLAPNMDALAQLSKELGVTGVHAFAFGEDGYTAHVRNFGPLYGVPEESATGTANAALYRHCQCCPDTLPAPAWHHCQRRQQPLPARRDHGTPIGGGVDHRQQRHHLGGRRVRNSSHWHTAYQSIACKG